MKTNTKLLVYGTALGLGLLYLKNRNKSQTSSQTSILKNQTSILLGPTGTLEFRRAEGNHGYGILGDNIYKGLINAGFINIKTPYLETDVSLNLDIPQKYFSTKGRTKIGYTMFEASRIPKSWYDGLNNIDRLFVPIKSNVETFRTEKLTEKTIDIIPICIDTEIYNSKRQELTHSDFFNNEFQNTFKFLIVNDGQSRKNNDIILRAFKEEFYNETVVGKVLLVTRLSNTRRFQYEGNTIRNTEGLYNVDRFLYDNEFPLLIKSCDCMVSASSGECGDIPILQAMAMEKTVIISDDKLVHTEIIEDAANKGYGKVGFLIDIDRYELAYADYEYISVGYLRGLEDAIWIVPSLEDLKRKMRYVYEHRDDEEINNIKRNASRYILENRNVDTMVNKMLDRFSKIKYEYINNFSQQYLTPSLAICSFMKNEASVVGNMLENVKRLCSDEIVVVDEYSTDGTRDILTSYNVKIINGELNNNYSNIRNLAIANVSPNIDWILFVDADEMLDNNLINMLGTSNGHRELIRFLENNGYDSAKIRRKNYIDGQLLTQSQYYPDYQARLFKNNGYIKYAGAIHEQLRGYNNMWSGDDNFHILHSKTSDRQIERHKKYNKIYREVGRFDLIKPEYD